MYVKKHIIAVLLLPFLLLISNYSQSADYGRPAGLMRIEIRPGEERLTSTPFDAFDSNLDLLLSGQLSGAASPENADQVKIWDTSVQDFKSVFLADNTGDPNRDGKWFKDNVNWEPSDITFSPGIGFSIKNSHLAAQTIFLSGRVPLDNSKILTLQPNLNLFSYPFSSKLLFNGSNMKNDGAIGGLNRTDNPDLVITDLPGSEQWLMDNPSDPNDGKWHDESNMISTFELMPGSSYWYERRGLTSFQWSENRPYNNLFNINSDTPSIVNMVFNAAHDEVTLNINCTGLPGEMLEVFYKDMGIDDSLSTETGWSIAEQNIPTSGNDHILWTDAGRITAVPPFENRCKINSIFMRIFIVSRQDIDSDNDGISNGQERFVYATNPESPDTDDDGLSDTLEINTYHTNPNNVDSDGDGYSDYQEINTYHTDPKNLARNPAVMPAGWINADIGSPGASGSARYFNGSYTVKGSGTDIYGKSDRFNYLYQDIYGNCEIIVKVTAQENTNTLAKAGIMIRENLNADSRNVFAFITPGTAGTEKCYYQARTIPGGTSARSGAYASATAYPYWLKLVKTENIYSSYKSDNGITWIPMYVNRTVNMGNAVKIGLSVTSMDNASTSTAVFESLSITKTLTETPAISPNGGVFQISRQVTLSTSVPDSQIRYSIDGSEPTETSTLYIAPFTIDTNRTLKAKLFKSGYTPGPTAIAVFNQPGLMVKYYAGKWTILPDFYPISPYKVSMIPNIDYPDNYGHIMTSERNDDVGAVITGQINCPVQGSYKFYLSSGEGAALYIDGKRLIYSPKLRTFAKTISSAVSLAAGLHDIKIEYFEASGPGGLQLKWSYPGQATATIPPSSFFSKDADADGLPDQWEIYQFGNLDNTGTEDTDDDGVSDKEELNLFFTDPSDPKSKPSDSLIPADVSDQIAVTYCAKNKRIWTSVPDFNLLPHYGAATVNQINYAKTTAKFATSGTATNVAAQFAGFIDIPSDGFYKFYLNCDNGANLYIDNNKIVDNDGLHAMRETYGFASLKAGKHSIRLDYCQTTSYNGLILSYEGPGLPKQIVPASALFHSPQYLQDMISANDPDSDGINTITASAVANGTISPSGEVRLEYGASQSFSIVPDENYRVSDVVIDGISAGAITSYQFTNVKVAHTIIANFALKEYTLTYLAGANGSITGITPQKVNYGCSGTVVTATPDEDYHFVNWSDGIETTSRTETNVTADKTVTANFAINTHYVTFDLAGKGTHTAGGELYQTVSHGSGASEPEIRANEGWTFTGWDKAFDNITADTTVTAQYSAVTYTVTFLEGENGIIMGNKVQTVNHGDSTEAVTAIPNSGYRFENWTGDITSTDTSPTIKNVVSDMTITSNFIRNVRIVTSDNPLQINEGENASCSVTLSESPDSDVNVTISFDSGCDSIILTSPSQLTFTPENWDQPQTIQFSCSNDNNADSETTAFRLDSGIYWTLKLYLMEKDKDVVISVNADNNGSVSPSGKIPKKIGDILTVTATPDANFLFDHWDGDIPEDKIRDNPIGLTIEKPCAITAIFNNNYRVLLKVNDVPSEWITISPEFTGGWESDISLYGGIAGAVSYLDDLDLTVYLDGILTSGISDGFESGAISNWAFGFVNSGTISVVDSPVFAGSKSLMIEGSAGNAQGIYYPGSAADKDSKLGFYVYLPSGLSEGDVPTALWYNGVCVSFCYQQNNQYTVRLGRSLSGTLTHSDIAASTWNYIELDFDHFVDTDFDGMDDEWEIRNFGDLSQDANGDFDHDGISNLREFLNGTDPKVSDPKVSFADPPFASVNKSAGTVNIGVTISPSPLKFPISVQVLLLDSTAVNGTDFTFTSPQNVVFGIGETSKTVPVTVIPGDDTGAPEKFARFGLSPQGGIGIGVNAAFILYINEVNTDSDDDGLPDWWEKKYFGNLAQTAEGDPDGDLVSNLIEYKQGRHPNAGAKVDSTNRLKLEVSF